MSEYKNGDTVRVVLEGKVANLDAFGFELQGDRVGDLFVAPQYDTVKSIEVLASPLKVGDVVYVGQYASLPTFTVAQGGHSSIWKLANGAWVDESGDQWSSHDLRAARTIKYLPE